MSDISTIKIDGVIYNIKDNTARTKLNDKLENISINGVAQDVVNNTVDIKTIADSEVTEMFK